MVKLVKINVSLWSGENFSLRRCKYIYIYVCEFTLMFLFDPFLTLFQRTNNSVELGGMMFD